MFHPHHNPPTAALADDYGAICAEIRGLGLRRDALKAALIERAGNNTVICGCRYRVTISMATRWTLDTAAVRAALGETWCRRHEPSSLT